MRKLAISAAAAALALAGWAQTGGYDQLYRPQVHFSPQKNWTNDPNGLILYRGEYHLFFQHNPFGDQWGHMSWGHAVSLDLLHWRELPVAIPEANGVAIFTGSVVVDQGNTSGLCGKQSECLVAVYTGNTDPPAPPHETQNLAVSLNNGRTWTKYPGNPVLDLRLADFRDPSVSWDESAKRWLMAVALPKEHKVLLYAAPDLKSWKQISEFGPAGAVSGDWECPDLLHIPSADGKGVGMWAMKVGLNPGALQGGSGEQYFLGSFNGTRFVESAQAGAHGWTNYGKDDYCAISFNGVPRNQPPVLLGWMSNWQYAKLLPTSPWRGQISLGRRLTLVEDKAGLALKQTPVVDGLREGAFASMALKPGSTMLGEADGPFMLRARFDSGSGLGSGLGFGPDAETVFGLRLRSDGQHWTDVGFDRVHGQFYVDRTHSGLAIGEGFLTRTNAPLASGRPMDVQLILDRSSVEAFAQGGTIAMTDLIFPPGTRTRIEWFSASGKPVAVHGELTRLKSGWPQEQTAGR